MDLEAIWCESCRQLQKKLELTQNEYMLNFSTLKKKIISTDMLVKKFVAKQQECETQSLKLDQMTKLVNQLHMDITTRDAELAKALQEVEPLKIIKETLETKQVAQTSQIQILEEKLLGAEQLQHQLQVALKQGENTELQQAALIKQHEKEKTKLKSVEDELKKLREEYEILNEAKKAAETRAAASLKLAVYFGRCLEKRGIIPCKASSQVSNYIRTCNWATKEAITAGVSISDNIETQLIKTLSLFGAAIETFSNEGSGEDSLDFRITEGSMAGSLRTIESFAKRQVNDSPGENRSVKFGQVKSVRRYRPFKDKKITSPKLNGSSSDKDSSVDKITLSDEEISKGPEEVEERLQTSGKAKELVLKSFKDSQNKVEKLDLSKKKGTEEPFEDVVHSRLSHEEESEEYISDDDLAGRQLEQLLLKDTEKCGRPKGCANRFSGVLKHNKQFSQVKQTRSYKSDISLKNNSSPNDSTVNSYSLTQGSDQECSEVGVDKNSAPNEILQQAHVPTPPIKITKELTNKKEPVFQIPLPKPAPISTRVSKCLKVLSNKKEKKHGSNRLGGADLFETIFHETRSRNLLSPLPPSPGPFEENSDDDFETDLENRLRTSYEVSDASHSLSRVDSKDLTSDDDDTAESRTAFAKCVKMKDDYPSLHPTSLLLGPKAPDNGTTASHLQEINDPTASLKTTCREFMQYIPEERLDVSENNDFASDGTSVTNGLAGSEIPLNTIEQRVSKILCVAESSLHPSNNTSEASNIPVSGGAVSNEAFNRTMNQDGVLEYSFFIRKTMELDKYSMTPFSSPEHASSVICDTLSVDKEDIHSIVEDLIKAVVLNDEKAKSENTSAVTSSDEMETATNITPVQSECDEVAERLFSSPANLKPSSIFYSEGIKSAITSPVSINNIEITVPANFDHPTTLLDHDLSLNGSLCSKSISSLFSPTSPVDFNLDSDSEKTFVSDGTQLCKSPVYSSSTLEANSEEQQSGDILDSCASVNQYLKADVQTKCASLPCESLPYISETNTTNNTRNHSGSKHTSIRSAESPPAKSRVDFSKNIPIQKRETLPLPLLDESSVAESTAFMKSVTSDNHSKQHVMNMMPNVKIEHTKTHASSLDTGNGKKNDTMENMEYNSLKQTSTNRSSELQCKYMKIKKQYEQHFVSKGIMTFTDTNRESAKKEISLRTNIHIGSDNQEDQNCLQNNNSRTRIRPKLSKRSSNANRKHVHYKSVAIIESSSSDDERNLDENIKTHEKFSSNVKQNGWCKTGFKRNSRINSDKPCGELAARENHILTNDVKYKTGVATEALKASVSRRKKVQQNCKKISNRNGTDYSHSINFNNCVKKNCESEYVIARDVEFEVNTRVAQKEDTNVNSRIDTEWFANDSELHVNHKSYSDVSINNALSPIQDFLQHEPSIVTNGKFNNVARADKEIEAQVEAPECMQTCAIDTESQLETQEDMENENTDEVIAYVETIEKDEKHEFQVDKRVFLENATIDIEKKEPDRNSESDLPKVIETNNNNTLDEMEYAFYGTSHTCCNCDDGAVCEIHQLPLDNQNFVSAKTSVWELETDSESQGDAQVGLMFREKEETDMESETDNLGRLEIAESTDVDSQVDSQEDIHPLNVASPSIFDISHNNLALVDIKNKTLSGYLVESEEADVLDTGDVIEIGRPSEGTLKEAKTEVNSSFKEKTKIYFESGRKTTHETQTVETKPPIEKCRKSICSPVPAIKTVPQSKLISSVVEPVLCTPNHTVARCSVTPATSLRPSGDKMCEGTVSEVKQFTPVDSPLSPLGSTPNYLIQTSRHENCFKSGRIAHRKLVVDSCSSPQSPEKVYRAKTNLLLQSCRKNNQAHKTLIRSGPSKSPSATTTPPIRTSTAKDDLFLDIPIKNGIRPLSKTVAKKTILSKRKLSDVNNSLGQSENGTFSSGGEMHLNPSRVVEVKYGNNTRVSKPERTVKVLSVSEIEPDANCYSQWPKVKVRTSLKRSASNENIIPFKQICDEGSSNTVSKSLTIASQAEIYEESVNGINSVTKQASVVFQSSVCKRRSNQMQNGAQVVPVVEQNVVGLRSSQRIKRRKTYSNEELPVCPSRSIKRQKTCGNSAASRKEKLPICTVKGVETSAANPDDPNNENKRASKIKLINSPSCGHDAAEDEMVNKSILQKDELSISKEVEASELTLNCDNKSWCVDGHPKSVELDRVGCKSERQTRLAHVCQSEVKREPDFCTSRRASTRKNKCCRYEFRTIVDLDYPQPTIMAKSNSNDGIQGFFFCRRQPLSDPSVPPNYRDLVRNTVIKLCRCKTNFLCSASKCPVPGLRLCVTKCGMKFLNNIDLVHDKQMQALIISYFQQSAIFSFFNSPEVMVTGKAMLARVYTALCKKLKDVEKPRILCHDLLYSGEPDSPFVIANIVDVWSEVLIYDGSSPLHEVIQFLLLHKVPNLKADDNLRSFLQSTCRITTHFKNSKDIVSALLTQLKVASQATDDELADKNEVIQSLVLVCKVRGWNWTNDFVIVELVWPVLQEWSSCQSKTVVDTEAKTEAQVTQANDDMFIACCLRLLGYLGCSCPMEKKTGILGIMKCMEKLLCEEHCNQIGTCIVEAAAEALVILKPYDPPLCQSILSSWNAVVQHTISSKLKTLISVAQIPWT